MYRRYFKRLLDIVLSLAGFIILLPVFLLTTLFFFLSNKGKPFFLQSRPGKQGKIFKLIKFKTMNDKKDVDGNLLSNAERITPFGSFIREFSLDEIPQLINVIKGDMSLIGPRPLLVEYLSLYNDKQKQRHDIRPGITGWAQVNGRNAISWQQKFDYDIWYINHISFILDIKILLLTIKKVFIREGINSAFRITMEKFQGNN